MASMDEMSRVLDHIQETPAEMKADARAYVEKHSGEDTETFLAMLGLDS